MSNWRRVLKEGLRDELRKRGVFIRLARSLPWGTSLVRDLAKLDLVGRGKVVLDVGANVGQFSTEILEHSPLTTVVAFEPMPEAFRKASGLMMRFATLTLEPFALGDETGECEVYVQQDSQLNSLSDRVNRPQCDSTESVRVSVRRLDDVLEEAHVPVSLLKLDVEGFELQVLRGAARLLERSQIRAVLTEVGFASHDERHTNYHALEAHLRDQHFELAGFYGQNFYDGHLGFCDALFLRAPE